MNSLIIVRKNASERLSKQITLLQTFLFNFKRKLQIETAMLLITTGLAIPIFTPKLMPYILLTLSIAFTYNLHNAYRYYTSYRRITEVVNEAATFQLLIQKGKVERPEELKAAYNGFVEKFKAHNTNLSSLIILEMI